MFVAKRVHRTFNQKIVNQQHTVLIQCLKFFKLLCSVKYCPIKRYLIVVAFLSITINSELLTGLIFVVAFSSADSLQPRLLADRRREEGGGGGDKRFVLKARQGYSRPAYGEQDSFHVFSMLLACCLYGARMLPACCQHVASMLQACYKQVPSMLPACCQHIASMLPQFCQDVASMLPACCQHVASMLSACYQ